MSSHLEHTNRRDFLKTSTLAALGASALGATGWRAEGQASRTSGRPFVTGVKGKKLVGCYAGISEILDEPKYMDALQQKLGVNAIIVSSNGIRMPDSLKALNPLQGKGWMGISPAKDNDDSQLVKAIEEVHRRGMDAWLYYTGHHYGQLYRPICAETFEGVAFNELPPIKYALCQILITVCFNKPSVVDWDLKAYTYGAETYDVDAIYVTHFRYANPAFFTNLFGCACPDCQKLAGQMGYNFAAMKKACQNLQANLKKLDKAKIQQAARAGYTLTDFMQLLANDREFINWLYFRSDSVGMRMKNIRDSIHKATKNRAQLISDTHNPTQALYVGHNYNDMMNGSSDGLMPLAWLDYQHISAVAALANLMVTWIPGLDEETAITSMLKFFGWDELPIQRKSIADFHIGVDSTAHKDTEFYESFNKEATLALWTHELQHIAMLNTKGIPSYPIIKGHQWTEPISRELIDRCMSMGHTGYIFQRTELFIDKTKL
ncbi:MAG: twin-arginine translocation signal domain-containing protein [Candidatus Latescibacter sp.]|nr:twin-arginine translocation signal domain-containing protein [Candidatus Latescibacter sp.]